MWKARGCCAQSFLGTVHDRSREIVIGLINQWILPGPTTINDCWAACSSLRDEGCTHFTVNHSVTIVDETAWVHTSTMESTWKQVKALLRPYNHREDYVVFLADYMFRQKCKAEDLYLLCKFIQIVATVYWSHTKSTDSQWRYVCIFAVRY